MVPNLFLQAQTSSPMGGPVFMLLMFAIVFFVLILPMQRQKKQQQKMLSGLQNGNTVMTTGGIVGTIVAIEGDELILKVKPDSVKLQVARSAISGLMGEKK